MAADTVFAAIDFETANRALTSACAVAVVRVESGTIVARCRELIRPPGVRFTFSNLHGITEEAVAQAPLFSEVWMRVYPLLNGARFLAAHNAIFDASVLRACCRRFHVTASTPRFLCTMGLARRRLGLHPTSLPNVCQALGIPLQHHDPLSDAEAAARIVLAIDGESRDGRA